MELLTNMLGIAASVAALAALPAAVVLGLVPRLGPGRAAVLALTSRLFLRASPASQRACDVQRLRAMLSTARKDQYVVVAGPKGVGKTCLVETATQFTCGVVAVRVPAGTAEKDILADVFTAVTRFYIRALDLSGSARRVLWWHHLLFRTPATVILQAAERKPSESFAALDSAARALSYDYGARVIIDASNNSLPGAALTTLREKVLDVEPMTRPVLEALPELDELLAALSDAGCADAVWASVGGVPANYLKLCGQWVDSGKADVAPVAAGFVQMLLIRAIGEVSSAVAADRNLKELYALFRSTATVRLSLLEEKGIVRPSPDKVLRAVIDRGAAQLVLVPADAAIALVLRFGFSTAPSMAELTSLVESEAVEATGPVVALPPREKRAKR